MTPMIGTKLATKFANVYRRSRPELKKILRNDYTLDVAVHKGKGVSCV